MALSSRSDGILASWDDDRGFGFITPAGGGRDVFVHIRAFPAGAERPQPGLELSFETEVRPDGRTRAKRVLPPGVTFAARPRRAARHPGEAGYLAIPAFLIVCVLIASFWPVQLWVGWLYLVASIVCFVVYAIDKARAVSGGWRVSETTLLILGFIGGWPGAIVAQQLFRHKTKKASFVSAFWGSVVLNAFAFVGFTIVASPRFATWMATFA